MRMCQLHEQLNHIILTYPSRSIVVPRRLTHFNGDQIPELFDFRPGHFCNSYLKCQTSMESFILKTNLTLKDFQFYLLLEHGVYSSGTAASMVQLCTPKMVLSLILWRCEELQ